MRKVRDWLLTVPLLVAFGLTLLVFDVAGRIVRPFSLRGFERVMGGLQRCLMWVFRIGGTRMQIERSPLIEPRIGYALVSNHQSLFDIAVIGGVLFSNYPKYVAKKELGRWLPSISLNLRKGGNALIDRRDRIASLRAITTMARTAQERDVSVVIFPEGTRSRDGALGGFKQAGTKMMLEAADRLDVVPVAIDGSWRLLVHNMLPVPFGTRIKVRFGDPIRRVRGDAEAVAASAEAWIRDTLAGWRTPGAEPAT
ncbi:MAG: 1-acyl-sn-glycerol-3-phosphate acyltransferase [Actinobacteria bacterium]|nr:1-acyl-sn-glycerol-3-phosphate acyltransferase [Actinomycetota bacterium]MBU1866546.1 1-acyl-sn-glycerol-3-phosphate acyltransferase [Actinomycetota bacterium]